MDEEAEIRSAVRRWLVVAAVVASLALLAGLVWVIGAVNDGAAEKKRADCELGLRADC